MITFRKLYKRIEEGEEINAIIAYNKYPWKMQRVDVTENFHPTHDGDMNKIWKDFVIQWRYNLMIDLWLVKINYRWLSKIKNV